MEKKIEVDVKLKGLNEATIKAERYIKLLKEAKTLADELASTKLDVVINEKQSNF